MCVVRNWSISLGRSPNLICIEAFGLTSLASQPPWGPKGVTYISSITMLFCSCFCIIKDRAGAWSTCICKFSLVLLANHWLQKVVGFIQKESLVCQLPSLCHFSHSHQCPQGPRRDLYPCTLLFLQSLPYELRVFPGVLSSPTTS